MNYYNLSVNEVLKTLNVSSKGLSSQEVNEKKKKFGLNVLKEKNKLNPIILFLRQFKSFIIYVLIFALIFSALTGEYVDAIVILIILLFNAILGFVQEFKAEKAIESLKKLSGINAKVIRDGKTYLIDSKELVPGDIILLEEGNKVPADARIIEQKNLQIMEAALTGESVPVSKQQKILDSKVVLAERTNMLYSGTNVTRGKARAVITKTGMDTEIGKIAEMLSVEKEETPLQKKLKKLGTKIVWVTLALVLLVFIAGIIKSGNLIYLSQGNLIGFIVSLEEWFLMAVSLAVAAVPEGLPAVVTITLAIGVKRMLKRKALIRRLPSVETLGETTVICTDKTGTLTMNKMTVQNAYTYKDDVDSNKSKDKELLFRIGVLCNDAEGKTGDPTEAALVASAEKFGIHKIKMRKAWKRIDEEPFDSERKMMSTLNINKKNKIVYSKGAPENIIECCSHILIKGKVRKLTKIHKKAILRKNEDYAKKALRVLGFAYKPYKTSRRMESNLIFVGLQAMKDPPRKEVIDSIEKCGRAGIRVMMLTGDNGTTAKSIAEEIGIKGAVMNGSEFVSLTKKQKERAIRNVNIFSRVEPRHKMEIVDILQDNGEIVTMTGDGVNDAPAIKSADLGVAMGITGTDVTKDSSDLILLDDNFSTIISAVEEGRGIYQNIKKFVSYLLSSNLAEVLFIFVAIILGFPLPMTAIMILWLNLATDGLPALALSMDPNPKDLMNRPPKKKDEPILDKTMTFNLVLVAVLITVFALATFNYAINIYASLPFDLHLQKIQTIAFTTLVMMELVRLQTIRSDYKIGFWSNKWLIYAVASSFFLQILIIYTPLSFFFGTTSLSLTDWIIMIIATFLVWVSRELVVRVPFVSNKYRT